MLIRGRGDSVGLALAVALAGIAGYVDAIGFVRLFGVFPANQSGNVVLFGIALGGDDAHDAWRPALAMAGFALGVLVAYRVGKRISERHRRWTLLTAETLALAVLALVARHWGGALWLAVLAVAACTVVDAALGPRRAREQGPDQ